MSAALYDSAVESLIRGDLDWEGGTIKVMLATGEYVPSQSEHGFRSDVGSGELASIGTYQRGGSALGGRSVTREGLLGATRLIATSAVNWQGITGRFRYVIVYNARGVPSEDELVTCSDLGEQTVVNANVTVQFDRDLGVTEFLVERSG